MKYLSHFEMFCWVAGLVGHATLLFVLIARRRMRMFPVFTVYVAYNIVETVWWYTISLSGTPQQQYASSVKALIVGYVVEIAFLLEISVKVMRATKVVVKQALFPFLLCSLICVTVARYASNRMSPDGVSGMNLWDLRFTYLALIITSFTYTFLLTAANLSCLPWRSHVAGIGEGFSIWLMCSTVMDGLHATLGWKSSDRLFDNISKAAYLATLVYWIIQLWFPERDSQGSSSAELEHFFDRMVHRMFLLQGGSFQYVGNSYSHRVDIAGRRKHRGSAVESNQILPYELGRSDCAIGTCVGRDCRHRHPAQESRPEVDVDRIFTDGEDGPER